jgi:hypothetical protein
VSEEHQQPDELTQEEMDELQAEELPQRHVLSVLRVPFLGAGQPVESTEPVEPTESELPDE